MINLLLIVEDDIGLQKQLKWSFDQYENLVAGNRQEALEAVNRYAPDVVILDLGLPPDPTNASEGLKTLTEILTVKPTTKVIVVTGNNDLNNAAQAIELGAYDFYQKPVDPDVLGKIIERAFQTSALIRHDQSNEVLNDCFDPLC
jgi:two-component system NtrC family response regulator